MSASDEDLANFLEAYQTATVWANGMQDSPDSFEPLSDGSLINE